MDRRSFILALALCVGVACAAGTARSEWQNFGVRDGLARGRVWTILEHSSGSLWFGTDGGVSRYDGVSWRTYTTADGLASDLVRAISEDSSGNLWFGTYGGGVSRYDGVSWRTYTTADGLGYNVVLAIMEDSSGNLWFGTYGGGVSRYDGVSWRTYTVADGLADNRVYAILEDSSGNLWFGTLGGVSRYDGVSWRTYTTADGLANNIVWAILEDRSGNLWFGTYDHGVSRYDGVSWHTYTVADGLADNSVRAILEDSSGSLWFGTWSGLNRYDGARWRTYTVANGLPDDCVLAITEDSSGNLWFGTFDGGVSRYDGVSWRIYTTADGLANNDVRAIKENSSGNLWFGTYGGGVTCYDGMSWRTYTTADGLANNDVRAIKEDRNGNLWFGTEGDVSCYDGVSWRTYTPAGLPGSQISAIEQDSDGNLWFGTASGLSRYNGVSWRIYTTADGLAENHVYSILEDGNGTLWFGTYGGGVSRYDGVSWRTYTTADGLGYNVVLAIMEDDRGNLWFGTYGGGVSRYDGVSWRTYTTADGLANNFVQAILKDGSGNLWFGTMGGVSRYDGTGWLTFTTADGLTNNNVSAVLEDRNGNLWFGACYEGGVTRHEPDRVAPQTVVWPQPPRLSGNTIQTIGFVAAFREIGWIEFSYSLDGSPWSDWSVTNSWHGSNLSDGQHVFRVRARDKMGNVDPTPAISEFEIDATPPVPVIAGPASGEAVRGVVSVRGTAADLRFRKYRIDVRSSGATSWDSVLESASPVVGGELCAWSTESLSDGNYELRLSVADTLGLTGATLVGVIVDNQAPWAYETTPALLRTAVGGDVYTSDGRVHVYFPPHAFKQDATVTIGALNEDVVPDVLPDGAERVFPGYEVGWGDVGLEKPGVLEFSYVAAGLESSIAGAAFYCFGADSVWHRVGGTHDAVSGKMSVPLSVSGRYALFSGGAVTGGPSSLAILSLTPRVFSPSGSFANDRLAISFVLGQPASVNVKVYNRAGRLVRDVLSGQVMSAGANLSYWDGRDGGGTVVPEGMYLVTVETEGHREAKTVSVVR